MDTRVFRYPRPLAWMLMVLSLVFVADLLLSPNQMHTAGWLVASIFVATPFALGLLALRYRIVVGEASVDVVALKRRHFKLEDAVSINVARGAKSGVTATIKFKDGRTLSFNNTVRGFRDLLDLLSQRTSLPVVKPVWDPDILAARKPNKAAISGIKDES